MQLKYSNAIIMIDISVCLMMWPPNLGVLLSRVLEGHPLPLKSDIQEGQLDFYPWATKYIFEMSCREERE